ncbi:hypothetical protein ABW19_dt0205603 [Dactylella cylindrospora]|nr:hypothetical protein ABW19_dt0205603 [Dactylella cylindrospora]
MILEICLIVGGIVYFKHRKQRKLAEREAQANGYGPNFRRTQSNSPPYYQPANPPQPMRNSMSKDRAQFQQYQQYQDGSVIGSVPVAPPHEGAWQGPGNVIGAEYPPPPAYSTLGVDERREVGASGSVNGVNTMGEQEQVLVEGAGDKKRRSLFHRR